MNKLHKLQQRVADALRSAAFRLDKQPLLRVQDVEASIDEHFAQHAAHDAQCDAQRVHAAYCAQHQAGEMGFWVPKRGSGSLN